MCGILLLADGRQEDHDDVLPGYWQSLQQACKCRGPHAHQEIKLQRRRETADGVDGSEGCNRHLFSSVLSLRGDGVTLQPLRSRDDRFALAWNGQVYAIEDSSASTSRVDVDEHKRRAAATERLQRGENDGQIVMAWLEEAILSKSQAFEAGVNASQAVEAALLEVLSNIEGEWAMVLIDVSGSEGVAQNLQTARAHTILMRANCRPSQGIYTTAVIPWEGDRFYAVIERGQRSC